MEKQIVEVSQKASDRRKKAGNLRSGWWNFCFDLVLAFAIYWLFLKIDLVIWKFEMPSEFLLSHMNHYEQFWFHVTFDVKFSLILSVLHTIYLSTIKMFKSYRWKWTIITWTIKLLFWNELSCLKTIRRLNWNQKQSSGGVL